MLDLSRVIAGPHCTRMLAELGADVIKLEPPSGDQTRSSGELRGTSSTGFVQLNLGKRLISLDLANDDARAIVRRLVDHVDVLVENFRPGVMAKWELDYETLRESHPDLVYVSISGYGQTGEWRHRRAYAPYVHAEAGYLDTIAGLTGEPLRHEAISTADVAAAKDATIALLAALRHRDRGFGGQRIDVSLAHSSLFMNEFASALLTSGAPRPRSGSTPQTIFTSADGASFSAGNPVSSQVFAKICRAFQCPQLIDDPRYVDSGSRRERRAELIAELQQALNNAGGIDAVEQRLSAEHLAIGRVRKMADMADAPWVIEREALQTTVDEFGNSVTLPSVPWRLSGLDATDDDSRRRTVAPIGHDNAEVLGELLGITADEVSQLVETGALAEPRSMPEPS